MSVAQSSYIVSEAKTISTMSVGKSRYSVSSSLRVAVDKARSIVSEGKCRTKLVSVAKST